MSAMGQEHDPPRESMREVKKHYEDAAETVLEGLQEMPPAFDAETIGNADTARLLNDAIGALFKHTAQQAGDLKATAD